MAAQEIVDSGCYSLVGDVPDLDRGHAREQLSRQMGDAAGAAGAERQRSGILLRKRDQLLDRSRRDRWMNDDTERRDADEAHRREILAGIVADVRDHARSDGQRRGIGLSQQVAVRGAFRDLTHRDRTDRTGPVLHDDLLAQCLAHLFCDDARHDVCSAAGGERHDQRDRTGRIGLRRRGFDTGDVANNPDDEQLQEKLHCNSPVKCRWKDSSLAGQIYQFGSDLLSGSAGSC